MLHACAWAYLWLIWAPRRLDMVSSKFCRRSAMFFTVLMRLVSGSSPADTTFKWFTRNSWTCTHTRTGDTMKTKQAFDDEDFCRISWSADVMTAKHQWQRTRKRLNKLILFWQMGRLMMTQPVGHHHVQFFWGCYFDSTVFPHWNCGFLGRGTQKAAAHPPEQKWRTEFTLCLPKVKKSKRFFPFFGYVVTQYQRW